MDSESEATVLSKIAEDINVSKLEIMFKKASCKVRGKLIQRYQYEINQQRILNMEARNTLLDRQTKLAQLQKHLTGLRSFTETMDNCKTESNKSLYEQKEKNRRYEEESQKIIKIYKDKWAQRKITYESLPLAVELKALQNQIKSSEFQLMVKTKTINYFIKPKNMYKEIQKQIKQNIIINFASYMVNTEEKKKVILALRKNVEENMLKSRILSDQLKLKNEARDGHFYRDSVKPLTNLPVKLNFSGYDLPDVEIPKETILNRIGSLKSHISGHSEPVQVVPMKELLKNTRKEQILYSSNLQKTNIEEGIEIELSNKKISKQNEYFEKSNFINNKKIEMLNSVVLKPEETFVILRDIKMNQQFNDNVTKARSVIKPADSKYPDGTEIYTEDYNLKKKLSQEICYQEVIVEQKEKKLKLDVTPPIIIEESVEQIDDDSEESGDNITSAPTADSDVGTQGSDKNETMNKKQYYEEKYILIQELKEKYSNMKLPQVTSHERNDPLKQQVPTPPLSPSVSKFFFKNENTKIDNDSSVHRNDQLDEETIKFSNKVEDTNRKEMTPNTEIGKKQTNLVLNQIDSSTTRVNGEYNNSFLSKTGSEVFEIQNTDMDALSMTSLDYSEYEDDSSVMNTGADFMPAKETVMNLEQKGEQHRERESNKILLRNGLGSFAKPSFSFFNSGHNDKNEKNKEKEPESSGFNVLFGISDEKKPKGNFFDFLK